LEEAESCRIEGIWEEVELTHWELGRARLVSNWNVRPVAFDAIVLLLFWQWRRVLIDILLVV